MGSCCSKPTEKTSDEDYRKKIKNDFASKLKELQKKEDAKAASNVKETKNNGSFSSPKFDNLFIMTTAVTAGAGNQGGCEGNDGSHHGDHHHHGGHHDGGCGDTGGGGSHHDGGGHGGGCGGGGSHHDGGGCGGGGCGGGGGGCGGCGES